MTNILEQPLIHAAPRGMVSLPALLDLLGRDAVDGFPALRPHQAPAWHMFLVQLAAMALHRAGRRDLPPDDAEWARCLRLLTADHPDDAPWCLVVDDWSKPAFLQPPVPDGVELGNRVPTADALDLLITAKNHDLKQAIAADGQAQDWIFALVSLQTGEGYGGAGNHGIVRMNGGSSSRPMLALAPLAAGGEKAMLVRPGAHFRRDVGRLLAGRSDLLARFDYFRLKGGIALAWLPPWPQDAQLRLGELDIWFIEVCRRIRLRGDGGQFHAVKGISKLPRIDGRQMKGAVGDPWAPRHSGEAKGFTLAERDFDYEILAELLLNGDWELPFLAQSDPSDREGETFALIAAALARGNSRTDGFKLCQLPLAGRVSRALSQTAKRKELHALAREQNETVARFLRALRYALALAAANGEREAIKKGHYGFAQEAGERFTRSVDAIFFPHLWARHAAQEQGVDAKAAADHQLETDLFERALEVFETALPAVPCRAIQRPRAEARAWRSLLGQRPQPLEQPVEEDAHADP